MPASRTKELIVQQQHNILVVKINRPHANNALNRNAVYELVAAVESATNNSLIKIVVITAVGNYFMDGSDLKLKQEHEKADEYFFGANYIMRALIQTFLACPKILVCLVNGPCIGIGFALAALCDAVYCTKNAYFQAPYSQLGLCPEACASFTFAQQFGQSWSTNLLIFGEKMSAYKAEYFGFVLEVLEDLEVEENFWPKMQEYSKLPEKSLRITKNLIRSSNKEHLMRALYAELKEIEKLRRGTAFLLKSPNKSKL